MKAGVFAVAAALVAGVSATGHAGRRHAHEAFHQARDLTTGVAEPTCGCTTIYTTVTGQGVLIQPKSTSTKAAVVPTPQVTTIHKPGVYTIPATTITLTSSTTVCAATSTKVPAGTHTYGGVTTIVKTSTTVVCPVATVVTEDGVVTSKIVTTTYVCPTPGTYTIAPETTTVSKATLIVYPTPVEYPPGKYVHDEIVTTITKTDYVVFCPLTSSKAPEPTPAPAPVTPTPAPAPAPAAPKVEAAPAPSAPILIEVPKPSIAAVVPVAAPVESPKAETQAAPVGTLGVTEGKWALTYTPYNEDSAGGCKSADAVKSDIALIASKGFKAIRVYATNCDALKNIPAAAAANGIKLILGVFIESAGIGAAQSQVDEIVAWGQFDLVDLIVVGNEALFTQPPRASAGELAAFIKSSKAAFRAGKYNGPVTTAEPLNIWQSNAAALCDAVDVVGLNIHPFFNADVEASQAGKFARGQLDIAAALCPGKDAYNLETGWPSAAQVCNGNGCSSCNGKACAGPAEQATAIKSIIAEMGSKSVLFSFKNDNWKADGAFGCEKHWGSIQLY